MNASRLLSVGFLILAGATTIAAADPPKRKYDPRKVEVVFADGSTVKMTIVQENVEITSRYGKFKVPVEDIVRIEFGFRYPEGVEQRVSAAIAGLGDSTFKKREAASNELLELGEYSYPALQDALKSSDSEVAKRAEEIAKKIEETVDAEKLSLPRHDVIVTKEFAFPGRIEATHFKAKTPYFGEIQVALSEIRGLRSIGATSQIAFTLEAAKYAALDTSIWRDTGIDVSKDTIIEVEASGTVYIYPGTSYPSTPDGYKGYQPPMGQPLSGALIARIGKNGDIFTLGSKGKHKANGNGRLYVRIQHGPWMTESTGSYEVKIKTTFGTSAADALPPKPIKREKDIKEKDFKEDKKKE